MAVVFCNRHMLIIFLIHLFYNQREEDRKKHHLWWKDNQFLEFSGCKIVPTIVPLAAEWWGYSEKRRRSLISTSLWSVPSQISVHKSWWNTQQQHWWRSRAATQKKWTTRENLLDSNLFCNHLHRHHLWGFPYRRHREMKSRKVKYLWRRNFGSYFSYLGKNKKLGSFLIKMRMITEISHFSYWLWVGSARSTWLKLKMWSSRKFLMSFTCCIAWP